MLILDHQEVIYCQVVRPSQGKFDKLPGLVYDERLFCKIESYPITDYKAAVNRTRQLFDQDHQEIIFLLVEEADTYTIWRQDQQLISLKDFAVKKDFFSPINLLGLLDKIGEINYSTENRVNRPQITKASV
jgi:hypothetical protein